MNLNKVINNYLVFVILFLFSFIVFWYSFIKENYFVVFLSLLLLLISQFKIETICHTSGKQRQLHNVIIGDDVEHLAPREVRRLLHIMDTVLGHISHERLDAFIKTKEYKDYKHLMKKLGMEK